MQFQPATREQAKLRMCIMGPAKSGKTYTSMKILSALCNNWAVLDTENGSASKYVGPFQFQDVKLTDHSPESYIEGIVAAYNQGFEGLIIDSLSHLWIGTNGCLELHGNLTSQDKRQDSFRAWDKVTPLYRKVMETINRAPLHIICTLRVKTEYSYERNERTGKLAPVKVGLKPEIRDGAEYEFDILMDMHEGVGRIDHTSRCHYLQHVAVKHPGQQVAQVIKAWLDGTPPPFDLNTPSEGDDEKLAKNGKILEPNAVPKDSNAMVTQQENPVNQSPNHQSSSLPAQGAGAVASASPSKVDQTMMSQLLQAGTANGWSRPQMSDYLCRQFNLTPQTITQLTVPQWQQAVGVFSMPAPQNLQAAQPVA